MKQLNDVIARYDTILKKRVIKLFFGKRLKRIYYWCLQPSAHLLLHIQWATGILQIARNVITLYRYYLNESNHPGRVCTIQLQTNSNVSVFSIILLEEVTWGLQPRYPTGARLRRGHQRYCLRFLREQSFLCLLKALSYLSVRVISIHFYLNKLSDQSVLSFSTLRFKNVCSEIVWD